MFPFLERDARMRKTIANNDMMILAPWVVAMRVPSIVYEFSTPWHATGLRRGGESEKAVIEKTAAILESYGAFQFEVCQTMTGMWADAMLGNTLDAKEFSRSLQDITDASINPMAKRVRANYRRLRKARDKSIYRVLS